VKQIKAVTISLASVLALVAAGTASFPWDRIGP
jgi:hypothetical protein